MNRIEKKLQSLQEKKEKADPCTGGSWSGYSGTWYSVF